MALSEDKQIIISYGADFPTFTISSSTSVIINLLKIDNTSIDVTNDVNTSIFTLDDNIVFDNATKILHFNKEGAGSLKAIYTNSFGETYSVEQKFVIYSTFFKDNYLNYFVSSFEKLKLSKNKKLKIMMDTMMEMLDILYAYNIESKLLNSFTGVKSDFLDLLGQNVGFERIDYENVNTSEEDSANKVYREILSNIFDLLNIRGTDLAYNLFFNAIGYNITLQEFWYNDKSDLIEINPYDDTLSSFYRYDTNGVNLDSPPFANKDPRRFVNNDNVFVNNKTNYVRPILSSINLDIAPTPSTFTVRKRNVIKEYLEYLRPSHVQYIQELIGATITQIPETLDVVFGDDFLSYLLQNIMVGNEVIDFIQEYFSQSKPIVYNEEYSFKKKWDTGFKWDAGNKWDDKQFFNESFAVTPA